MRYFRRARTAESPGAGEDSFLDIVSNMVGILIILVMIAGFRLGRAVPEEEPRADREEPSAAARQEETARQEEIARKKEIAQKEELARKEAARRQEEARKEEALGRARYLELADRYHQERDGILALQKEVSELNDQAAILKMQADSSQKEYAELMQKAAELEALIERLRREKSDEKIAFAQNSAELTRLQETLDLLTKTKEALAGARPKAQLLENRPTPISKKLEGSEAVFAIRAGRISYVPIGEFAELVRGAFRSMREFKDDRIEQVLGPYDGYRFHYVAAIHKEPTDEGIRMTCVFEGGEFDPVDALPGEEVAEALKDGSAFRKKLSIFIPESNTITLSVYPDSYKELREVKKFLQDQGYTLALRPMPAGERISISPHGTESTLY
ncbi:MAG: hypothetical protein IJG02_09170 [Thermoguttaceae bacterium]|nr:hypothetical protein [Thermoguttaceae bacterium]